MKPHEEDLPPLEQELLDQLVDDELSDSQRRELLSSLERRPDGWRRCALAFLEAQAWKKELRHVVPPPAERPALPAGQPPASAPAAAPTVEPVPRRPFYYGGRWSTILAMAGGFLVALVISNQIRPGGQSPTSSQPGAADQASLARAGRSAEPASSPAADPWQMVTLTSNDPGGNRQTVRLPAREGNHLDEKLWQPSSGMIPDEVLKALRDSGHQIRHSRQFLPVPMQDGRKLVVPIDEVDVDDTGSSQYQ